MFAAVAGLPTKIVDPFTQRLTREHQDLRVLAAPPSTSATAYSTEYLDNLYARIAKGLRGVPQAGHQGRWGLNLVLLYLRRCHHEAGELLERFGLEALPLPLNIGKMPPSVGTNNQVNRSVNALLHDARRLLRAARQILVAVTHEVTVRDNRSCALLPRANYGPTFEDVAHCVHDAVVNGIGAEGLREGLRNLEARLKKDSKGYFKGRGGLVFEAPAKSGARHGIAPGWGATGHSDRCVVRGHLRFGAAFEPNFHYDCKLRKGGSRQFVSCHGNETLKRGRSHVNIAPNDNIR